MKRKRSSNGFSQKKRFRPYVSKPIKRYVARAIGRGKETKQITLGEINTTVGSYGSGSALNYLLTAIGQGDDVYQREGNLIKVTGFYARFTVTYQDTTNIVRFLLWQPRGDNTVTGSTLEVGTPVDQDTTRVWKDIVVSIGSAGPMSKTIVIKKKFARPLIFRYYDTATSNYVTPPMFFTVVSDSGTAAHPACRGHFRLYFKDY